MLVSYNGVSDNFLKRFRIIFIADVYNINIFKLREVNFYEYFLHIYHFNEINKVTVRLQRHIYSHWFPIHPLLLKQL